MTFIQVVGARENNLKNLSVKLPLNQFVAIGGPSGSGKTSLVFKTIYNESKRQVLNSLPTSFRFFGERPSRPEVDLLAPLLPTFSLFQSNPIVGSKGQLIDNLGIDRSIQNLFLHHGEFWCEKHQTFFEEMSTVLLKLQRYGNDEDIFEKKEILYILLPKERLRPDFFPSYSVTKGKSPKVRDFDSQDPYFVHKRIRLSGFSNVEEKLLEIEEDNFFLFIPSLKKIEEVKRGDQYCCPSCLKNEKKPLGPRDMSPFNTKGACAQCNGFGQLLEYDDEKVLGRADQILGDGLFILSYKKFEKYQNDFLKFLKKKKINADRKIGSLQKNEKELFFKGDKDFIGIDKLISGLEKKKYKLHVRVFISKLKRYSDCHHCTKTRVNPDFLKLVLPDIKVDLRLLLSSSIDDAYALIEKVKSSFSKKIKTSLYWAKKLGLGHLPLNFSLKSLSSSEYQRSLLLKFLSFEGRDSLFLLDEPSKYLNNNYLDILGQIFTQLVDQGNSVFIIDHNKRLLSQSSHYLHMGPKSGPLGGEIVFQGEFENFRDREEDVSFNWNKPFSTKFKKGVLKGFYEKNLNLVVDIDRGDLLKRWFEKVKSEIPEEELLIGNSARRNTTGGVSTVGSLTGLHQILIKQVLKSPEAKVLGMIPGNFSSRSNHGKCSHCEGRGKHIIDLKFMEDVEVKCEECLGRKLKRSYSEFIWNERPFYKWMELPIREVFEEVSGIAPSGRRALDFLKMLNLDHLNLSRKISSLSGGEYQRINLIKSFSSVIKDKVIVLENISSGLSHSDQKRLFLVFERLVESNNSLFLLDESELFKSTFQTKFSLSQVVQN